MAATKKYCFALDLKPDSVSIAAYEAHHRAVWPGIIKSLDAAGVKHMEIYRTGNRLFMIIEAGEDFSLENKKQLDAANPLVKEWEELMWRYQQSLPGALPGERWVLMNKIFSL